MHSTTTNSTSRLVVLLLAPLLWGSQAFHTVGRVRRFSVSSQLQLQLQLQRHRARPPTMSTVALHQSSPVGSGDNPNDAVDEPSGESVGATSDGASSPSDPAATTTAATNTINERLMAELKEAEQTERFGSKKNGKSMGLVDGYGRARKTDAEIQAAIAEARDLNGVNPVVAILGSFFAFGVAGALWVATNKLGGYFASHPPETEVYFVQRTAQVFRNVVMGMISLASGFFGVTGLGIFGMGVRVAYGVATGELDPTPIKNNKSAASTKETVNMGNMMDLMMNKKPGRRGGGKK